MRLHLLITDLEIGGTPRVVKELAIRLRPLGFETSVACLASWGPVADELRDAGVPVTAFGARGVRDLPATVAKTRRWASDADVVFSFLLHANAVAACALAGTGTPLIASIQTTQPWPAWHWWLHGLIGQVARRIVVPSPSVAAMAAERSGLVGDRIVVIPNAVDVVAFGQSAISGVGEKRDAHVAEIDAAIQFDVKAKAQSGSAWRVGFVGRLDPIKRVPDLIDAIARMPDARLDVYGNGSDRQAVEAAVRRLGVCDRVSLHGTVKSSVPALLASDVLVLPSDAEGFGLVLIEAMAAGVPVVATNVAGIRDVVQNGVNGLLVPPRNPAAIAAAVQRVRADAELRNLLIAGGHAAVASRYGWDAVLAKYAELLRSVIA